MRKVFIRRPVTSDFCSGVFAYDYMPSIIRDMRCDRFGFYHSQGSQIELDEYVERRSHFVHGWDLGNGNILSQERKIIECKEYRCESRKALYVAYTYPYLQDDSESYAVYLYTIPLAEEALIKDPSINIFDQYTPVQVFSDGINGGLDFHNTEVGLYLDWLNKSGNDAKELTPYSYDIDNHIISEGNTLVNATSEHTIDAVIETNKASYIHYHRVGESDLHVCVIEPEVSFQRPSPVIVICLGGPNIPIPRFDEASSIYEKFRQRGFYVIVPLRRGVIGISNEWTSAINRNAGQVDVEDVIKGMEFALDEYGDVIDADRVGVYGASYGGFTGLLIAGTDVCKGKIKAVASHCGMSDLERYPFECYAIPEDVMEYYTGVECFQDKARLVSPYSYIENWNSSVLLVHTIDDTSVWFGQSVRSYNKGVSCGKDVRLILAPGPHSYDIPNAEHLFDEIIGFFLVELNHMSKI